MYFPEEIKKQIAERAQFACEYCRYADKYGYSSFHIEHIRPPLKHNGSSEIDNLAYSCPPCNNAKGSNIGTYLDSSTLFTRLFNPRIDIWSGHFEMVDGVVQSKSEVGAATIHILNMNSLSRILERRKIEILER